MGKGTPHSMCGFLLGQAAAGHRSPTMPSDVLRMIHQRYKDKRIDQTRMDIKNFVKNILYVEGSRNTVNEFSETEFPSDR